MQLGFDELRQHVDVLRLHSGMSLTLRFVEPRDAEPLQNYFRSLSSRSRYNRFLGAISELPPAELEHFIHAGEDGRFSVIAIAAIDGFETIVGEARYAIDAETGRFEFALSVDDRWQGHGIGSALLRNLECRAAAFGAVRMVGDTLRSNDVMIGLARKSGFVLAAQSPTTGSWCASESISTPSRRTFPARAGDLPRRVQCRAAQRPIRSDRPSRSNFP